MLRMQGSARGIALDIVRADGRRQPVLVSSVLERGADAEPVVVRTAVFDAVERREYERELLRAKEQAEASEARARALAQTLQQTLVPPAPPRVPGLDVAAAYRPAGDGTEVGGDFYDVFEVGVGDWVLVIGDVCGKGVDAAAVTALARYTLRAAAVRMPQPSQALETLNEVLLRHPTERFCTAVLVRLRLHDGAWTATIGVAGHPLPLLAAPGTAPTRVGRAGSLLGVLAAPAFHDTKLALHPGDTLVLFTDGVTEGRRGPEFYGEDRLRAVVGATTGPAGARVGAVVDDVLRFQSGRPSDDVAVVAVGVPAGPEPG